MKCSWPPTSLLNPTFRYTKSHATDIAETFRRARERLELEKAQALANAAEVEAKVEPLAKWRRM